MSLRWIATVFMCLGATGLGFAKPPELPVQVQVECRVCDGETPCCEQVLPHEPIAVEICPACPASFKIRRCVAAGCECSDTCSCATKCECGKDSKCSSACSCAAEKCQCNDGCSCGTGCKCGADQACGPDCKCAKACDCSKSCACKDQCKCGAGSQCGEACTCAKACDCSKGCACKDQCQCGTGSQCGEACTCPASCQTNSPGCVKHQRRGLSARSVGTCTMIVAVQCCPPMHLLSFNPALRTAACQAITPCVQRTARKCKEWLAEAQARQYECPQQIVEPLDEEIQEALDEPAEVEVIGFMPQEWTDDGATEETEEAPMPRSVKQGGCPFLQWKISVIKSENPKQCLKAGCIVTKECGQARKASSSKACNDACKKACQGCKECCETPCKGCTNECGKTARKECGKSESMEAKILHNINQLIRAQRLIIKAEALRQDGAYDRATRCYEKVQQLCPGSRLDSLASRRIDEMVDEKAADQEKAATEEAEAFPAPLYNNRTLPCEPEANQDWGCVPIAVEVRVAEALEACQRMLTAGCFADALTMARQALALDPACCPAQALIAQIQSILGIEEQSEPAEVCPVMPYDEPSEALDPCTQLRPCLPPVPCDLVPILAEILRVVGEPKVINLVVSEEEPCEQPCQMPADWKLLGLYVEPNAGDLELSEDGEEQSYQRDVIQAVVDYFKECGYVEIDLNQEGHRGWIQLGVIHCNWSSKSGQGYVCLGLSPGEEADPRDQQCEHYQGVIDWIESMNSGPEEQVFQTGVIEPEQGAYYPDEDVEVTLDD